MFIAKFDVQRSAAMDNGGALVEVKKCISPSLHLFTENAENIDPREEM